VRFFVPSLEALATDHDAARLPRGHNAAQRRLLVMDTPNPVTRLEKLTRIWSQRREKTIAVRVHYSLEDGDCRVFRLERVEELE
jgi:hypothetical protein